MLPKNLIEALKGLGLTEYESKVYASLAMHGVQAAGRLSDRAEVPQSKVYEVLKGLKSKALISFWGTKPQMYKATEPKTALKRMLEVKKSGIQSLERNTLNLLKFLKPPKNDSSSFWMSKGKREFFEKSCEMLERTESIAWATTSRFSRNPQLDEAIADALKRGVEIRLLGTEMLDRSNRARAEWYLNNGAKIRMHPMDIHPIIGVTDGKEICLRIDHVEDSEYIWSNNPVLVSIVKSYFETLWDRGVEICRTVSLQY